MTMDGLEAPRPWTMPVAVEDVPETARHVELLPDKPVRAKVAELAGVLGLSRLQASFDLTRQGTDALRVVGIVSATVEQTCVVTLEAIQTDVEETIDLLFTSQSAAAVAAKSHDGDAEEPPERLQDGVVDLGAVATEFLLLGIDPYPRKPNAVFETPTAGEVGGGTFAALAALKPDSDKKGR